VYLWIANPMNIVSAGVAYQIPRDALRIRTPDARVLALADRLWEQAPSGSAIDRRIPAPIAFNIDVDAGDRGRGPWGRGDVEEERWHVGTDDVELNVGNHLRAHIDLSRALVDAIVSHRLLTEDPALVMRLLLETPTAALLARRGYGVLHAGAVVGPAGAVVLRGAAGSGKSTLVAAAYQAGMGVLGDETVLAARGDPDDLIAGVRDLLLLPDAARLLGLDRGATPALGKDGEAKFRIDLTRDSTPARRRARRVATVLLGPWQSQPARLERLTPIEFLRRFPDGGITQEQWSGTPPDIAAAWAESGNVFQLSGAADLRGALTLLQNLVRLPAVQHRA
jgi:hypothetical protein